MASKQKSKLPDPDSQPAAADLKPISDTFPVLLARARETAMAHLRPILRRHDLTEQQWRVLRTVSDAKEMDLTQLADVSSLMPASLSRIVQDLTERQLVARRIVSKRQRYAPIYVTRAGSALIAKISPEIVLVNTRMVELFGEQRMGELVALLQEFERTVAVQL